MTNIYTQKDSNRRRTVFLMGMFLVFVIAIGYAAAWYIGNPIILYVAVGFAFVMNFVSYWYSDRIVLRMTGARLVSKTEAPELYNIVENLAITAGLPMPKVYIIDDPSPNAFATGRNPEHAAVAATTGLLAILDRNELEGVMAHEMSHIGNRDILVMTVAVVLAGFIAILADFFMRALWFGGGARDKHPIFLILAIVGIILAPIAAKLIKMAVSRKREYLADAAGALLTRYPEGLASALEKISRHSQPMRRVSHATAHLFISDPLPDVGKRSLGQRINHLFSTHPPVEERVRLLRGMDA
jgi:heat shock protein HtpX